MAEHPAAEMVGSAVLAAAGATTDVGAALLRLAVGGQHAELIARLAAALLAGDGLDVEVALDGLLVKGIELGWRRGRRRAAGARRREGAAPDRPAGFKFFFFFFFFFF